MSEFVEGIGSTDQVPPVQVEEVSVDINGKILNQEDNMVASENGSSTMANTPVILPSRTTEKIETPFKNNNNKINDNQNMINNDKDSTVEAGSPRSMSNINDTEENSNNTETAPPPPQQQESLQEKPAVVKLRPSLRGKLVRTGNQIIWSGSWGMDDNAFKGGIVSPFNYKRIEVTVDQSSNNLDESKHQLVNEIPGSDVLKNSLFSGSFSMLMNGRSKKIQEKNILFEFTHDEECDEGIIKVLGSGTNAFGSYILEGTLVLSTGELNVYREYKVIPPKNANQIPQKVSRQTSRKKINTATTTPVVRRQVSQASILSDSGIIRNQRMRRAPSHLVADMMDDSSLEDMLRLKNIVRDVSRADRDGWFCAPVDAVALGLRNYHKVITNPMDLGTILKKFEAKTYTKIEEGIEDVRLTFNNAIKFNPAENGVHQAAKRYLDMFEVQIKKLGQSSKKKSVEPKKLPKNKGLSSRKSKSNVFGSDGDSDSEDSSDSGDDGIVKSSGKKRVKTKQSTTGSKNRKRARKSGRSKEDYNDELTRLRAQLETCYSTIQEISSVQLGLAQAQMHQMQNNVGGGTLPGGGGAYQPGMQSINKVNNKPNVGKPKVSGPRPLSYQEKRQLGLDIRKLQPEMLDGVIQIIQESGAELQTDEDGDVEIDIDGLDTPALKKMQKYVKKNLNKMRQHM